MLRVEDRERQSTLGYDPGLEILETLAERRIVPSQERHENQQAE